MGEMKPMTSLSHGAQAEGSQCQWLQPKQASLFQPARLVVRTLASREIDTDSYRAGLWVANERMRRCLSRDRWDFLQCPTGPSVDH
jgi:hypothetical protein